MTECTGTGRSGTESPVTECTGRPSSQGNQVAGETEWLRGTSAKQIKRNERQNRLGGQSVKGSLAPMGTECSDGPIGMNMVLFAHLGHRMYIMTCSTGHL